MFRFENQAAFQFLWLIPVVVLVFIYLQRQQQKRLEKYFEHHLLKYLVSSLSKTKRWIKFALQSLCLLFMILALARPQSGQGEQKVKSEGIEVVFMVDVSTSMLAEDVRPSRLELAKKELSRFVAKSQGHRIGLIAFAGSAILLSPVTQDKGALRMYIEALSTDIVSSQGTEFKRPLEMAESAFQRGGVEDGPESVVTRAIVIASDGEDNEPGAMELAKELHKKGVRIFTLAFGTEKGAPIPLRDQFGETRGYKKDKSGKTILTETKGTVLKNLASMGKGSFYHVNLGRSIVEPLLEDLNLLEKSTFEAAKMVNYNEHFQWPLALALLFGFIELILGERKSPSRVWRGRFTS